MRKKIAGKITGQRIAPYFLGWFNWRELMEYHPTDYKQEDPDGINQHAPGAKLDKGKQRPSLIFDSMSRALSGVVQVGTFGAAKYSDGGWLEVNNGIDRYRDAQLRHESAIARGELVDPESGLPHDFHRAWNVLAQVELKARRGDYASE